MAKEGWKEWKKSKMKQRCFQVDVGLDKRVGRRVGISKTPKKLKGTSGQVTGKRVEIG